jgi:DNA-binding transcriptional LysR family regulator
MEMQQVRYFLAVARTLNFTRAAEECNVSQPALTRAIKLLEEELGGDLIRREGRFSHLTELGQRMAPLLRQCYDSALSAKSLATSIKKGEVSTLAVAVAQTLDLSLLMAPLDEMLRNFPGLQLKLRRGNAAAIAEMLKSGQVEIAIGGPLGEQWDRLDAWPMFTEAFDLIVGAEHQLAQRNDFELDVELIRDARFLIHRGSDASDDDHVLIGQAGIDLANAHEVDSDRDLEALVLANVGIGLAPSSALRSPTLKHIACPTLELRRTVAVYSVAGRQRTREASALLNLMRSGDWSGAGC